MRLPKYVPARPSGEIAWRKGTKFGIDESEGIRSLIM